MELSGVVAVVAFPIFWIIHTRYNLSKATSDLKWILAFLVWLNLDRIQFAASGFGMSVFDHRYLVLLASFAFLSIFLLLQHIFDNFTRAGTSREHPQISHVNGAVQLGSFRLQPLIFPAKVYHARLFPKKHSFNYSYLMVGVPVGWRGSVKGFLSADLDRKLLVNGSSSSGWLDVRSEDHLQRGHIPGGLRAKLDLYLESIV